MDAKPDVPASESSAQSEPEDGVAEGLGESPPVGGHLDDSVEGMRERLAGDPSSFNLD
jgi:hypothetical protein